MIELVNGQFLTVQGGLFRNSFLQLTCDVADSYFQSSTSFIETELFGSATSFLMSKPKTTTLHCFYCGKKLVKSGNKCNDNKSYPTQDHLTPKSRGGKNSKENRVIACKECNGDKGSLTLEEYRIVIAFRQGLAKKYNKLKFFGEK